MHLHIILVKLIQTSNSIVGFKSEQAHHMNYG